MTESLQDYICRTVFMQDSLPETGGFQTNRSLEAKVNPDGSFKPFFGDTLIFDLDRRSKAYLRMLQDDLYNHFGSILAERIPHETFHLTLHDLLSSGEGMPPRSDDVMHEIREIFSDWPCNFPKEIHLRSVCMFNMVNTSIVMGYEPVNEEDCRLLMDLYDGFHQVVPLWYPLTLHVTLAYFKPGFYDEIVLQKLRKFLAEHGRDPLPLTLKLHDLAYARFDSMMKYDLQMRLP